MTEEKDKQNLPKRFRNLRKVLAAGLAIAGSQVQLRSEEQERQTADYRKPELEIYQVYDRGTAQKSNDLGSFLESEDVQNSAGDDAEHIYATETIRGTEHYRTAREALQHAYADPTAETPACRQDVQKEIESLEAELTAQLNSDNVFVYSGRTLEIAKKLFAYKLAMEDAEKEEKKENCAGVFKILKIDEKDKKGE